MLIKAKEQQQARCLSKQVLMWFSVYHEDSVYCHGTWSEIFQWNVLLEILLKKGSTVCEKVLVFKILIRNILWKKNLNYWNIMFQNF